MTVSVSLLAASTTVSSEVTIWEVRKLCLKNSALTIISAPVCLLYTLKYRWCSIGVPKSYFSCANTGHPKGASDW